MPGSSLDALLDSIQRKELRLRDYQQECVDTIMAQPKGSRSLVIMATGLGKTGTFTHLPPESGRTLIIAAGKEIVLNPLQYYPRAVKTAVEMAEYHAKEDSPDAQVVVASIQTISQEKRLHAFDPNEFQTIIIDEAHHSTAETYRRVVDYFKPDRLVGFTATAERADGVQLSKVFDRVIYRRDLPWAIRNGHLTDVVLRKVKGNFDLRNIRAKRASGDAVADFTDADLAKAMEQSAPEIVSIYKQYAYGPTIINVAGVRLAREIADLIPLSVAITGEMSTEERQTILDAFLAGTVMCLVNVGVLKEGVDLPAVSSVIMARPTLSLLLYIQLMGRGLRPYEGKDHLNLIEIEGKVADNVDVCSAPMVIGVDLARIPKREKVKFNLQRLTDMPRIAREIMEAPENWDLSTKNAQAWADAEGLELDGVNWMYMPDGHLELSFPLTDRQSKSEVQCRMSLSAPDISDRTQIGCTRMPMQLALDLCRRYLKDNFAKQQHFWDSAAMLDKWGRRAASPKQTAFLRYVFPEMDTAGMTAAQASMLIYKQKRKKGDSLPIRQIYPIDPIEPPPHYSNCEQFRIDGRRTLVYDYAFAPDAGVIAAAAKSELRRDYAGWLIDVIENVYLKNKCAGDVKVLIEVINNKKRLDIAKGYLKSREGRKYRYLQTMDNVNVSRQEVLTYLAEQADILIPVIIAHGQDSDKADVVKLMKATVDLSKPPLSMLRFEFSDSMKILTRRRYHPSKLDSEIAEIKETDKKRWLKKQQANKGRKRESSKT